MRFISILSLSLLLLLSAAAPAVELQLLWSVTGQFEMPESAVIDQKRQFVYVSNVNEYALDSNGYVSRVSLDGKHIEQRWVTGLNSPTGMSIAGDTLYVADVDALVLIDLNAGEIKQRFLAPDADEFPVLNDVAISEDGKVFVSGSRSRSIYVFANNTLTLWIHDKERLKNANGLLVDSGRLLHGGTHWSAYDLATKKRLSFPTITPALTEFDGITKLTESTFLVTLVDDAKLWIVEENGRASAVSDRQWNGIDIHYHMQNGLLAMPQVGGHLSVFQLIDSK